MNSSIAWLDASADEQRRVRELIALFEQPGTLDELGLGQVRDVMSNALFPGTSVLLTRARYFVFIPWSYLSRQATGRIGSDLKAQVDRSQRVLIETLRSSHQTGVIGAIAGAKVRTLPSTIYWNGLITFGILRRDVAPEALSAVRPLLDDADELATRFESDWHPSIPPVPPGFPEKLEGGLEMTADEAGWLRERIVDSVPGTLLAHLATADRAPDRTSPHPWRDEVAMSSQGKAADALGHAHMFSLAMLGATRLYGVLVAEAYERAGFNALQDPVASHADAFREWAEQIAEERHFLEAWELDDFWRFVYERNARVSSLTRRFVQSWVDAVRSGSAAGALGLDAPRQLVADRERAVKRVQARLSNTRLLGLWSGAVASGLDYRWPAVKTIITDIHEGLGRA